jgi:hypothetical protein
MATAEQINEFFAGVTADLDEEIHGFTSNAGFALVAWVRGMEEAPGSLMIFAPPEDQAVVTKALRVAADAQDAERGTMPKTFQERARDWALECFGFYSMKNVLHRCYRFLEEALELVQSLGMSRKEAHQLVDYVFGRDKGDPWQEAGGVQLTLAALCTSTDIDMAKAGEMELARVWTKIETIRAKEATKPRSGPLPGKSPEERR